MKYKTKIKICGIKKINNAKCVLENKADYLGLIFVKKSRRYIDFFTAEKLIKEIKKTNYQTKIVGVFENESSETINDYVEKLKLDFAQIAGKFDDDLLGKIKYPKIIQISIKEDDSEKNISKIINHYRTLNHKILLDSFDKNIGGGTGKKFNWKLVKNLVQSENVFLAGGLNSKNIKEALNFLPWGVDISSGVEENGEKDNRKIAKFIKMVRTHEKQ